MDSNEQKILNAIQPFELLDILRNEFASHRSSSAFKNSLKKLGFNPSQKKSLIIKSIINNLIEQLQKIHEILEKNESNF